MKRPRGRDKAKLIPTAARNELRRLAVPASKLTEARAAVNSYAAASKDQSGRNMLGLAIGAHLVAMRRLQLQLENPLPISQRRKQRKAKHAK
jgi:hypothetical protein